MAGEDISRRVELTGEDLLTQLADNDGKITFTVPEGLDMQVQIICTDCAMQPDGSTNEYNELFQRSRYPRVSGLCFMRINRCSTVLLQSCAYR